jgi:hemoglobin-like flavoprotein
MAVAGLDKLDTLVTAVEDLGGRHARYGVKDAHYDSVGAALLWTLEQSLGTAWNAESKAAWTEVYGLLSGIMRRAQREAMAAAA